MTDTTVTDEQSRSRFEAYLDGRLAGFAEYARAGDLVVFTHTEVDPQFEGRGVASALAREALDTVRARGLQAVPLCPFFRSYVERHPQYADLVFRSSTPATVD